MATMKDSELKAAIAAAIADRVIPHMQAFCASMRDLHDRLAMMSLLVDEFGKTEQSEDDIADVTRKIAALKQPASGPH